MSHEAEFSMLKLRVFIEKACVGMGTPEPEYEELVNVMGTLSHRISSLEAKVETQQLAVFELLQASKDAARVMDMARVSSQKNALVRLTDALTGIGRATKL